MSSLHSLILNLPISPSEFTGGLFPSTAYKEGHRDALRAAADLVLETDKRIEELEEALKGLQRQYCGSPNDSGFCPNTLWGRVEELVGVAK